jgi:uncharacterized membrane protein YgcG
MMKSAYNEQWVHGLHVIKLAKRWLKHGLIDEARFEAITQAYHTPVFHPNFAMRMLLFIATIIATSGVSGLVMLLFSEAGESTIGVVCILFGVVAFIALERLFISKRHYKSGVTEGVAYMACGFIIGGVALLVDFDSVLAIQLVMLFVVGVAAFRYLDLVLTFCFIITLVWCVYYQFYEAGGIFRNIIPFVFIITFSGFYFFVRRLITRESLQVWNHNLLILEAGSLLLVYAGGNYLVVRELTVNMMGVVLEPDQDIPFAVLFYFFTLAIPLLYLFVGIKSKNIVLMRAGMVSLGFSVYTFKHYFLPDFTEVFLIVTGSLLIITVIALMRYLKAIKGGFTSENILSSAWADLNAEAFIISQTMGGNQPEKIETNETGGGGSSGGGGASTSF